ncbi:MAG: DHH family phosphoesterase, partial [Roseococcus sp.]
METALGVERSLTGRRWVWRHSEPRMAAALSQQLSLPEIVGRLLAARGIDPDSAGLFLEPTLRALLPDPSVLLEMDAAAARLADAVQRGETVAVFADYDVDGACSGAVMVQAFRTLGCTVFPYVPDRLAEGYGPNGPAIAGLVAKGATLIVCVDCGIAAHEALAGAGADIVVLDHHKAEGPPPRVVAAVNPNRLDCPSGLRQLCAAGVAFLDADEFLFDPQWRSLPNWLDGLEDDVGAVAVNQRVFGSAGRIEIDDEDLVIRRFTKRATLDYPEHNWVKTIARPECVATFHFSHTVELREGRYIMTDGSPREVAGKHPAQAAIVAVAQLRGQATASG